MVWFERRIEILISVEADNEEDASDRLEESWPASQIFGVTVELWPDGSKSDEWVKAEG